MRFRVLFLCLAIALILLVGAAASAATTGTGTIVLHPGDNWIAAPVIPLDPSPQSVFQGIDLDGRLTYFDPATQSPITYRTSEPSSQRGILIGDGYVLNYTGTTAVTVEVAGIILDYTDVWIALPGSGSGGGQHWIGHTTSGNVLLDHIIVTDGMEAHSLPQAVALGWIDGIWNTFDGATQTVRNVGISGLTADDRYLRNGHMYKLNTYQRDLAMIVPMPVAVPEPSGMLAALIGLAGVAARRRIPPPEN